MSRRRFSGYAKASRPQKDHGGMNRTEREYADLILAPRIARGEVVQWWFESFTFKLAHDCRYTPDFVVLLASGELEVHEVKGPLVRDDARAKLKLAAGLFPLRFWMMQKAAKKDGGRWTFEEIPSDSWTALTVQEAA